MKSNVLECQAEASITRMALNTAIILLNSISIGTSVSYSIAAVEMYPDTKSYIPIPLDEDQVSWIGKYFVICIPYIHYKMYLTVSIMQISFMTFILLSGFLNEYFGRKKTILLGQFIILTGWFLVYFTKSYQLLVVARFLMGIGVGTCYPTTYLYLSEIALVRYRGSVSIMNTVTVNLAFVYMVVLVLSFNFDGLILMAALPGFLFMMVWPVLPESPIWLLKKKCNEKAEKSLISLRGPNYSLKAEIDEISEVLDTDESEVSDIKDKIEQLKSPNVFKPLCMMTILFILQPLSGGDTITFYSLDIFTQADISVADEYILSILLNCAFLLGYIVSVFTMPYFPRRVLFLTSCVSMSIFMALIGCSFKDDLIPYEYKSVLLPVSVTLAAVSYGIGLGPVLASLLGEVFPQSVKSVASSVGLSARNITIFFLLKSFPDLVGCIGLHLLFWAHACILILTAFLAFFIMPETHGKTLTELSNLYEKKEENSKM